MFEFLKFVIIWLLFMAVLGVIALIVPKLALKIDKAKEKYKGTKKESVFPLGQTSFMEPAEKTESNENEKQVENNENLADGQRTE